MFERRCSGNASVASTPEEQYLEDPDNMAPKDLCAESLLVPKEVFCSAYRHLVISWEVAVDTISCLSAAVQILSLEREELLRPFYIGPLY